MTRWRAELGWQGCMIARIASKVAIPAEESGMARFAKAADVEAADIELKLCRP
ncbi:MAG: hypothetical protein ACRC1V_01725 [Plesiomonas sp.]